MIKPLLTSLILLLLYSCKGPTSTKISPSADTAVTKGAGKPFTPITAPDSIAPVAKVDTSSKPIIAKNWIGSWKSVDKFSGGRLDITTGVLTTKAQDKKFRQMVGEDYHLFVNSSQIVGNGKDLDSLHAIVHDSWVKHELTSMRNIVLINDRLDIWAAVIDEDSIKYYTTREDYHHKLPKTIDNWQKDLEDKKLIFK